MKIIVHDFSGHAFTAQLARALAVRGHDVLYASFGGFQTPKGKTTRREDGELASGAPVNDSYRRSLVGVRADWEHGKDRFSVIGNATRGRFDQPAPGEISGAAGPAALGRVRSDGINLSARWERALGDGGSLVLLQLLTEKTAPKGTARRSLGLRRKRNERKHQFASRVGKGKGKAVEAAEVPAAETAKSAE